MAIKNTADLREMLIQTIEGVKDGKVDPRQAQAIANLSSKILHSAKLDLEVIRFNSIHEGTMKAGDKVLQLVNK